MEIRLQVDRELSHAVDTWLVAHCSADSYSVEVDSITLVTIVNSTTLRHDYTISVEIRDISAYTQFVMTFGDLVVA